MVLFEKLLSGKKEWKDLQAALSSGLFPLSVTGLTEQAKAQLAASVCSEKGFCGMVVCDSDYAARQFCEDVSFFMGKEAIYYPSKEIEYYKERLGNFLFSDIVLQFFSKYFGGYYDLRSISRKNYIKLLIIFKHIMESMGFVYIHQIMTGNLSKLVKRRKISNKQLKKIEKSKRFMKLMEQYSHGINPDNNPILRNIAMLINTPIEYCDYNQQSMEGELINADIEIVADEYIRFLKMIS